MFSPAEVSYSVYTLYKEVEYYVTQPHLNQRFLAHILMHRLVYVKEITSYHLQLIGRKNIISGFFSSILLSVNLEGDSIVQKWGWSPNHEKVSWALRHM